MTQKPKYEISSIRKKRISVSRKRQITIPVEFFNKLGIEQEVDCYIQNNAIIISPVKESSGEFDEEILADLISRGFSGSELLAKFREIRLQIRPAVERLLNDARLAADGKAEYSTYEDVFEPEDN